MSESNKPLLSFEEVVGSIVGKEVIHFEMQELRVLRRPFNRAEVLLVNAQIVLAGGLVFQGDLRFEAGMGLLNQLEAEDRKKTGNYWPNP